MLLSSRWEWHAHLVFEPLIGKMFHLGGAMDAVRSALQCFCCCVGVAPSAHLHKKNAWQLYLIGYTALPVACGSS